MTGATLVSACRTGFFVLASQRYVSKVKERRPLRTTYAWVDKTSTWDVLLRSVFTSGQSLALRFAFEVITLLTETPFAAKISGTRLANVFGNVLAYQSLISAGTPSTLEKFPIQTTIAKSRIGAASAWSFCADGATAAQATRKRIAFAKPRYFAMRISASFICESPEYCVEMSGARNGFLDGKSFHPGKYGIGYVAYSSPVDSNAR